MTNKDKAQIVTDIIIAAVLRNTSTRVDPIRVMQEVWSEGHTMAERGDDRLWCQFILAQESKGTTFWYDRIKAAVTRRFKRGL